MVSIKSNKKLHKQSKLKVITLTLVASLIVVILSTTIPFLGKIYPNTYIAGIYVGDLKKDAAIEKLKREFVLPKSIYLIIDDKENEISTSEFIETIDFDKTVERAYNYTNGGNFIDNSHQKLRLIFNPKDMPVSLKVNETKLIESINILSKKFSQEPLYPSLKYVKGMVVVDPGKDGFNINKTSLKNEIVKDLSYAKSNRLSVNFEEVKVKLNKDEEDNFRARGQNLVGRFVEVKYKNSQDFQETISINDSKLLTFLEFGDSKYNTNLILNEITEIAKQVNQGPQDSVFIVENEVVKEFVPSKNGITLQEDKFRELIIKSLESLESSNEKSVAIDLPIITVEPKISLDEVNNLGIKTLIGKGDSYFRGSIPNRVHNVNHATNKFKGILVPPNEVFSFNKVLGDVSALTGYKSAYVIKDGKTVLGDGGGVCQVSTTLFRAVLNAGLPIVERRPHSYRVGYYEQGFAPGLDATVYYPTTDFKFKNDTPNYILIQPSINLKNYSLTFEIYGTNDGRVSTVSKPVITSSTAPEADLYIDDPALPSGQVKQIEHRAYGARVVFDYKVTRNGETLIDQRFVSTYRPWQAVYLKGVGQ